MKYGYRILCLAFVAMIVAGCDSSKSSYEIGCKAEKVYFKNDSSYMWHLEKDTLMDDETKCYYVTTFQAPGVMNYRCELFSPEHNLLMVLGMCSECCIAQGFKFSYDSIGRTSCVAYVQIDQWELEGENEDTSMFNEMLRLYNNNDSAWTRHEIKRDSCGRVVRIGNLICPDDYDCEYGVYDSGNFWYGDVDGGDVHFIVKIHEINDSNMPMSTYDLYYMDGKLAVETLCWNGKVVKSIAYRQNGRAAALYGNEKTPLDIVLNDCCLQYFCGKSLFYDL